VGVSRGCPFLGTPIISGTGRATDFKFCRNIHRVDRNKSPWKMLVIVDIGVVRESRNFSGHPRIGLIARSVIFAIAQLPNDFTYRNLHSFARFSGDSTALVLQYTRKFSKADRPARYSFAFTYSPLSIYTSVIFYLLPTYILDRVPALHFCRWQYIPRSENFKTVLSERQNATTLEAEPETDFNAKWPFRVIQGHLFPCHWEATKELHSKI